MPPAQNLSNYRNPDGIGEYMSEERYSASFDGGASFPEDNILHPSHADRILQHADDSAAVMEFIQQLEEHRIQAEKECKYEEAELAKTRLEQLALHEQNRQKEVCRSAQLAERLAVEEAHMFELKEFNAVWDQKVEDFEEHAEVLQQTLHGRQEQELKAHLKKYDEDTKRKTMKPSKHLLNQKRIEEYAEEFEKHCRQMDEQFLVKEEQLVSKQKLEMEGLLKRIRSGREEQKQARKVELQRLLQRYHNVKTQLESSQNIARLKQEKSSAAAYNPRNVASTASLHSPLKKTPVKSSGYGQRTPARDNRRSGGSAFTGRFSN